MTDTDEKSKFINTILKAQLGDFVCWDRSEAPPALGHKYILEIGQRRKDVEAVLERERFILSIQETSDLETAYDADGNVLDQEIAKHWKNVRANAPFSRIMAKIHQAGLGKPNLIVDVEYWSRMEWLELKEAKWLSVGLDPREDWSDHLTYHNQRRPGHRKELEHVQAQYDQLSRFVDKTDPFGKKFRGPELLDWIEATGFPSHPNFIKVLQIKAARESGQGVSASDDVSRKQTREDPRAVRAVARIITAIAIEEYGYDPKAKRSPIPNEIVAIMDRLGLQGTAETVLKYLKIGADDLPDA